jgi:hypothetical protein
MEPGIKKIIAGIADNPRTLEGLGGAFESVRDYTRKGWYEMERKYYEVGDYATGGGSSSLLDDNPEIDAKTPSEAIHKYLANIGIDKPVRLYNGMGAGFVITPMVNIDGVKYQDRRGRRVMCYEFTPKRIDEKDGRK